MCSARSVALSERIAAFLHVAALLHIGRDLLRGLIPSYRLGPFRVSTSVALVIVPSLGLGSFRHSVVCLLRDLSCLPA